MPELPEVETIRLDLSRYILNRRIIAVTILSPKTASHSEAFFKAKLAGRRISEIRRRGKLLIFSFSGSEYYLLIHLKMTGQLIYLGKDTKIAGGHSLKSIKAGRVSDLASAVGGELPNKYTRAIIALSAGGYLYFNDLRKFGYLKLATSTELDKLLKNNYGLEPLTPEFTLVDFRQMLDRDTKIKALLLNQKIIAGLGNIYVDEALWAARISPKRPAKKINPAEAKKLWQEIERILKLAIKNRGTTFNNYVDSRGKKGNYSRFLKVYGRQGEKCPNCHKPIIKIKIAGRGTHYCSNCQK